MAIELIEGQAPSNRSSRGVPWTRLVLVAAAVLFFIRMRERVDPDLFFHLKEGGRVLAERRMPLVEEYSYTRAGKAMVATEWLSGAAFAAAFRAGGYPLVSGLNVLLLIGALGLAAGEPKDDGEKRPAGDGAAEPARALAAALAAFALLNFALAKVQNFTFFFFALFLFWVRAWENGRRWAPWAMAAALAPWVNLHGGFLLGWILLGGVCALDFWRTRRAAALAPWAAGTFACFLHPNGATAFVYPIWFFFAAPPGRSLVVEWRPLAWAPSAIPYTLIAAAALAARPDRLRGRFPWAALVLVFLVLGLRTRKMMPFFALSAAYAMGLSWARTAMTPVRTRLCLAGALGCLLTIAGIETAEARALSAYGPASDWQREYPREAAAQFAARFSGRRLFHPYEWGGYLEFVLPPGNPVFIDGRLDPYWTLLGDYEALIHAAPGWRRLFAAYGIEAALLPPRAALAAALDRDPGWKAIGSDGRATLFVKVPVLR